MNLIERKGEHHMKRILKIACLVLVFAAAARCSDFMNDESDADADVTDADTDSDAVADVPADPDAIDPPPDEGPDADALDDGTETDALVDGLDVEPDGGRCLRGDGSGGQGDPCTCADDCSEETPVCMLAAESDRYCAAIGCLEEGAPECEAGSECVGINRFPGLSFCRQCVGSSGNPGDPCRCESDCPPVTVDGRERTQACVDGICALSPCGTTAPCPDGYTCQGNIVRSWCAECLDPSVPAGFEEACVCNTDCEADLVCIGDACGIEGCELEAAADCPEGYECRAQLSGVTRCIAESSLCTGDGSGTIGQLCACNEDCSESAPVCLEASLSGINVGGCTVWPCRILSASPCPEGDGGELFSCCFIPGLVNEPSCLPTTVMDTLGLSSFCRP